MPVRMVGAAAGRITWKALRSGFTSSVLRDVEPLAAHAGTPNAVLISIGQTEQMKITKMPRDRRVLDRVERERHPGERRDRLQHLDERDRARGSTSGDMPIRKPSGIATSAARPKPSADARQRVARAGCRCPCRSGRCRRTDRRGCVTTVSPICASVGKPADFASSRRVLAEQLRVLDLLGRQAGRARAPPPAASRGARSRGAAPGPASDSSDDCSFERSAGVIASDLLDREARRRTPPAWPDRTPCPSP